MAAKRGAAAKKSAAKKTSSKSTKAKSPVTSSKKAVSKKGTAKKGTAKRGAVSKSTAKKGAVKKSKVTRQSDPNIRQGDKAAFVRGLARSLAASVVVDEARALGMIISKAYVHNIRSAANKASRALMAREGKKTVSGPRPKLESQFKQLVVSLGPARAKKLLAQVETSLSIASTKKRG